MAASEGELRGRLPSLTKYEIVEEIGHGGMATVYRARDPRLGRDVAIKVIHPHLRDSAEVAHRFQVEAQAVAKLRHANIVEVFDVSGEDDREQYLVVELVKGRTLRRMLQDRSPLPPEVAASIALQLLAALDHAHEEGVVHRDIKPENVLIEAGSQAVKIKLTDFGIAKLLDAKGVTSTGQVLGSPAHMAPEQIEGGEVDARSDVFGMGVLLYECMVGHLPFEGGNPAQVLRRVLEGVYSPAEMELGTVGKAWSMLLDRALAREAADRFESAGAMSKAITLELERLGITDPAAEIAAYMEDPEGYETGHEARLVARLRERGSAARRRGDVLGAASDYNRALAYAPTDPSLLKVVSTMHRASERMELAKKIGPTIALMLLGVLVAFFATRAIKHSFFSAVDPSASSSASVPSAKPSASVAPSAGPSVSTPVASVSAPPTTTRTAPVIAPLPSLRRLNFVSVKPLNGVTVAIDEGAPTAIVSGSFIPIDTEAHVLTFSCAAKGYCEDETRRLGAGKDPLDDQTVDLKITPATLVVEGDASKHYGIRELPEIVVKVGVPVSVPMGGAGKRFVTVVDRDEPDHTKDVTLNAGKESKVAGP